MIYNKINFTLTIALLSLYSLVAQTNKISGELTGTTGKMVSAVQVYYDGRFENIKVDKETQTFNGELNLSKPQFVEFTTGGATSSFVFVVPEHDFSITFDKPTLNETIVTISNGTIKNINQVMERFYETIEQADISKKTKDWQKELIGRYQLVVKALANARQEMLALDTLLSKEAPEFKENFEDFENIITKYILIDEYSLEEIENILDEISKSEMEKTVLTIPVYRQFLADITKAYAARKLENYDLLLDYQKEGYIANTIAAEACVEYIPNQTVINYLFYDKVQNELALSNVKHQKYLDFLFEHSGKAVEDRFGQRYKELKANLTGEAKGERAQAEDFEFKDAEGKSYTLADFKGKLLLIDFWASWCGPCKAQNPYLKELEEHYEGKNIVIASVSLDVDKKAWLKSAEEENLQNLVLHAEGAFKNPFPVAYGVNSIPRYMLIDSEGKIISDNMPKPQNKKEVMAMIDADLYKAELSEVLSKHYKALGAEKLMADNTLLIKSESSFMSIGVDQEIRYTYPMNFGFVYKVKDNPALLPAVGEDFFKEQYMEITKDTIIGNIKNIYNQSKDWTNKLGGLNIFLASEVRGAEIELAEENSNNEDNFHVLKATSDRGVEKYFIDKDDFLIKKVVQTAKIPARQGGGTIEATTKYDDYREVDGVMIPYTSDSNNIIKMKITEAKLVSSDNRNQK